MNQTEKRLQALLATRRNIAPGDEYLQSFLPEFHHRLRMQSIRRPSLRAILWERFQESIGALQDHLVLDFSPALRFAALACVVALAGFLALEPSVLHKNENALLTVNSYSTDGSHAKYSMADAGDLTFASAMDQKYDGVGNFTSTRGVKASYVQQLPSQPQYALPNRPLTYEDQLAF